MVLSTSINRHETKERGRHSDGSSTRSRTSQNGCDDGNGIIDSSDGSDSVVVVAAAAGGGAVVLGVVAAAAAVAMNRGPQYRPQHTIILVNRSILTVLTPRKGPPLSVTLKYISPTQPLDRDPTTCTL